MNRYLSGLLQMLLHSYVRTVKRGFMQGGLQADGKISDSTGYAHFLADFHHQCDSAHS